VTDPAEMAYPVPWPAEVPFIKKPKQWTIPDMWKLALWLRECGLSKGREFINPDIAARARTELDSLLPTNEAGKAKSRKRARQPNLVELPLEMPVA
jgi:hypothetical protein